MLAHELVTEIFGVEGLELVSNGRTLHKEHAAANLQGIGYSGQGLFHQLKSTTDDPIHRDGHATAGNLVAKHVNPLKAHLLNDHVEEVNAVRAGLAQAKTNGRVHNLEGNSREPSATTHVNHAGRPLGHVGVDQRTVGIVPLHHSLKSV